MSDNKDTFPNTRLFFSLSSIRRYTRRFTNENKQIDKFNSPKFKLPKAILMGARFVVKILWIANY